MNLKLILIFFCITFIVVGCCIKPVKVAVRKKSEGTTLYMNTLKDTLTVSEAENNWQDSDKIDKIFYNNKDYTSYVKDLINSRPLAFASSRMLIFGEEEVRFKSNVWRCAEGIVFIPGEKDVSFMEASYISYHEEKEVLKGKDATLRKIDLAGKEKEDHKFGDITIDFSKK